MAAGAAGQRVPQAVAEQGAIGQARELVVECLMRELMLQRLALGDVAGVDDDAIDGGVVEEVLGDGLEGPPGSVGVTGPELEDRLAADGCGYVGDSTSDRLPIRRMDGRRQGPIDRVVRLVPEDSGDRRAGI